VRKKKLSALIEPCSRTTTENYENRRSGKEGEPLCRDCVPKIENPMRERKELGHGKRKRVTIFSEKKKRRDRCSIGKKQGEACDLA